MRERDGEKEKRERREQEGAGEAHSPLSREPGAGLDLRILGSQPEPPRRPQKSILICKILFRMSTLTVIS